VKTGAVGLGGYAVSQGGIHEVGDLLGVAYWIPALLVPPLLVIHYLVFQLLWGSLRGTKTIKP